MRSYHFLFLGLPLAACSGSTVMPLDTGADSGPFDATVGDLGEAAPDGTLPHDVFDGASSDDAASGPAAPDAMSDRSDALSPDAADAGAGGEASTASDSGGCPAGYLACAGSCVPSDAHNCGTCGHDCTVLPHVTGTVSCDPTSQCSFAPSACAPGWAHCSTVVDSGCETDVTVPAHCGNCTTTCSGATPLCAGSGSTRSCASACASGLSQCGASCVDITSDGSNCGGCGAAFACTGGKTCQSGQCQCQAGTTHDCGGTCVSNASTASCGASCSACPGGPANGYATCSGSTCGTACNSGFSPCNGACVNEQTDPANCGGCSSSFACAAGATCQSGACTGGPKTFTVHVAPNGAHSFQPSSVTIHVGDTVMWTWDFGGHTVTSGSSCTADSKFCSPTNTACSTVSTSNAGATYSHTFASAGTFPYFCRLHCLAGMTGSVVVQ